MPYNILGRSLGSVSMLRYIDGNDDSPVAIIYQTTILGQWNIFYLWLHYKPFKHLFAILE